MNEVFKVKDEIFNIVYLIMEGKLIEYIDDGIERPWVKFKKINSLSIGKKEMVEAIISGCYNKNLLLNSHIHVVLIYDKVLVYNIDHKLYFFYKDNLLEYKLLCLKEKDVELLFEGLSNKFKVYDITDKVHSELLNSNLPTIDYNNIKVFNAIHDKIVSLGGKFICCTIHFDNTILGISTENKTRYYIYMNDELIRIKDNELIQKLNEDTKYFKILHRY